MSKVCPICGKGVTKYNRIYCSRECINKSASIKRIDKIYPVSKIDLSKYFNI